jgi:hypothetical protein
MKQRFLGRSGLKISPLVFGGNVFGWTVDETMAFQLLDAFVAAVTTSTCTSLISTMPPCRSMKPSKPINS